MISRKPIYDDLPPFPRVPKTTPSDSNASPDPTPTSPSPTDRLALQVRRARLSLYSLSASAETRINDIMTRFLSLESSFTSTIASLAPDPTTNEHLMPGALYVLVSAMAGSIISRNRNILLRASVPVAVGIGAGWVVLPHTMRNVGDLVWKYEEKVPVVAANHMRFKGAVVESWRQAEVHGKLARAWADERVRVAREALQEWIRKGR
ncbi:MAG: hypothetical protein Q9187_002857 [Circinaria calcarea]